MNDLTSNKILITGGTGFLGQHVTKKLVENNLKPLVLTRNVQNSPSKLWNAEVTFVEADLLDRNTVISILEKCRPKKIVHLAGVTHRIGDETDFFQKYNFEATKILIDAAEKINPEKIIILGTADEYGFQKCPHKETLATMPVSDYAISKNKAVNYAVSAFEEKKLPVVIMRPFTVYGIGQPKKMFVSQAVECALGNLPFEMSKGEQKRDLLFVEDFADAIIKALVVENIEGEIFNLGSGKSIELRELAKKIWDVARADESLLKIGARATNKNELHDTEADISKAEMILGWQPKISLDEGLRKVIDYKRRELNEREISIGR